MSSGFIFFSVQGDGLRYPSPALPTLLVLHGPVAGCQGPGKGQDRAVDRRSLCCPGPPSAGVYCAAVVEVQVLSQFWHCGYVLNLPGRSACVVWMAHRSSGLPLLSWLTQAATPS